MFLQKFMEFRILLLWGVFTALITGCGSPSSDEAADGSKIGYELVGRVVAVNPEARTALIDHEEIPQFMPAMVMEFSISEGDVKVLKEGMRLRGRMFATDDGYRLEKIWPIDV